MSENNSKRYIYWKLNVCNIIIIIIIIIIMLVWSMNLTIYFLKKLEVRKIIKKDIFFEYSLDFGTM